MLFSNSLQRQPKDFIRIISNLTVLVWIFLKNVEVGPHEELSPV